MRLADGNQASIGDVIITRSNDRRLRLTATDWVKNGDRWTITHVGRGGDLTVRHNRSQLTVRLPADYISTSTGLGYATTIHTAQGVSADTMHGVLTGQESRQQLYTMITRGRHANHLYLQVVGDGDPHTVIRPDTIAPRTPTETLQQILSRDEAPVSASTVLRELNNPDARLFQAVQRYTDGLHVAAEQLVGAPTVAELDQADQYIPGLTTNRPGRPCGPNCSPSPPKPVSTHSATCWQPPPVATSALPATWPPSSTGASQSSRLSTQVRCLGSRAYQKPSTAIPPGGPTWQSDPNWSPTLPTKSKITPAKVKPSQSGHQRKPTRAPPLLAKSQCGGPPTASIPKIHDQPEEANSKRSRPCGNNASTGLSRAPPTRQQMRGPTSDRQRTPHLDAGTTTRSARTKNPNGVQSGRPRPADNTPQSSDRGARQMITSRGDGRTGSTLPNLALFIMIARPG